MTVSVNDEDINVIVEGFSLKDTLDCGQCFRWKNISNSEWDCFEGVAYNKHLVLCQKENLLVFKDTSLDDYYKIWQEYFDLTTDYESIKSIITKDITIKKSCEYAGGIRILKQDPWETICSFIISQNNNIPRIKGIIDNYCVTFGTRFDNTYSFPTPEILSTKTLDQLSITKAGFRNKYILDAAQKISSGHVDISKINDMDIDEARELLRSIKGIGPKVSECILLFGFYRLEAFPIDVWIKRALDYFYKDGFPQDITQYRGVAQQYIFHYIRTCEEAIPKEYRKNNL